MSQQLEQEPSIDSFVVMEQDQGFLEELVAPIAAYIVELRIANQVQKHVDLALTDKTDGPGIITNEYIDDLVMRVEGALDAGASRLADWSAEFSALTLEMKLLEEQSQDVWAAAMNLDRLEQYKLSHKIDTGAKTVDAIDWILYEEGMKVGFPGEKSASVNDLVAELRSACRRQFNEWIWEWRADIRQFLPESVAKLIRVSDDIVPADSNEPINLDPKQLAVVRFCIYMALLSEKSVNYLGKRIAERLAPPDGR